MFDKLFRDEYASRIHQWQCIDASPTYLASLNTPIRLKQAYHINNLRFAVILREPAQRAFSDFRAWIHEGELVSADLRPS
jgi:hypothetical protein